jgi:hypothetical protein
MKPRFPARLATLSAGACLALIDPDPNDTWATEESALGGGQIPDGGNPKDVLVELPAGFIGDPAAFPVRCGHGGKAPRQAGGRRKR